MKQFYLFILIIITNLTFSQNFTDTKGELQISAAGTATYSLPIATPPSIKSVAPIINLTYSSGVRGGIAGQGWSINSISTISRIATRKDIDGFVDGVDFDSYDKLALDGQRLLIKTGTYWENGSTYETEYKSNTKIELKTEGTIVYFIVTAPDGSRSWYGSKGSGSLQNSVSLNAWYIVHYEDVNGNFIDYNYKTVAYAGTNQLYIDNIAFSGNTIAGIATQNKISFNYEEAARVERDFLKGTSLYATQILKNIAVYANNATFRTYALMHTEDSFGYQRVKEIQEINAQGEPSNPVVFEYDKTTASTTKIEKPYINNLDFDEAQLAGDFDGDGRLDFVANNQVYTNLFVGNSGNTPISLPFVVNKNSSLVATTISDNKLNQFQSIVNANVINKTAIEFDVYNLTEGSIQKKYTKSIALDLTKKKGTITTASGSMLAIKCLEAFKNSDLCGNPMVSYQEGDFDGNGISEILIFRDTNECDAKIQQFVREPSYVFNPQDCPITITERSGTESFYLLDLDPNQSTALGSKGYMTVLSSDLAIDTFLNVKYVGDFNGDSKSDILQIGRDGSYRIIEISRADNFAYTNLLGSGVLDKYSFSKQLLLGDFNGDGKTDIMIPDSEGGKDHVKWHIYYSNPNPAKGDFFVKESQDIVEYRPDTSKESKPYDTQVHFSNYYAMDINGDGKSDLVRVWRKYFKVEGKINNHDAEWAISAFTNNVGKRNTSGFMQTYDSGIFRNASPVLGIPLVSNYRYDGANTDLVFVRAKNNIVEYYQFNKNVDTENRLISVTESNGNIKQTIEYKPMEAANSSFGNSSTDFYSSENGVNYPNIEIIRNSGAYLVAKLTATINGVSKYQDFRYRGYVSNFNYGTVGFVKTTRSSWYLNSGDAKIWTTQFNDVALRGANTITWTSTDGTTVFNTTPTNLLSTKTNEFAIYTEGARDIVSSRTIPNTITIQDPVTVGQTYKASGSITSFSKVNDDVAVIYQAPEIMLKPGFVASANNNSKFTASPGTASQGGSAPNSNGSVYNVLLTKQTTIDHMTGVKNETSFSYDGTVQSTNYFGLQVRSVLKQYSGGTLQGTTTVDTEYDNNPTGVGNTYYVGRPKKINSSKTVYTGDNRTSEEKYTYTGSNLTRTEKKGHNTYPIIEDMSYDALGNLLTKTVSAPAAPTAPVPRTIADEYDSTKRFVVKKTDHQGFVTNFVYNAVGQVTKSTDYLGVVNDYAYDNWGKLISTTIQNVSSTPLVSTVGYTKLSDGGYSTTSVNNTGAATTTRYDVLGRAVVTSTKGFASGSWVSKQIVYDGLGRKTKESEPYFSSPGQWTLYEYDYLMRPEKITSHTGKVQSLSYSGLTTTSNDDGKVTTITVDALGNKIQTTDPGGAVNFIYYADGQLKESDYQGNKVSMSIDGWGNKVAMTDPSAGTYTYSYDAFAQIKTETTPNGTTAYVYDSAGKITEKTIVGNNTNSKTTYVYNPTTNLITTSTFVNNLEGNSITNSFEYDSYKRVSKTIENTPYATFTKEITYDTFGRADKETAIAAIGGKSSSKKLKHTYQNGFAWQIVDDATQQVLWQTNSLNERGQLTNASLGNGIAVNNNYDQYGYASQFKWDRTVANPGNVMTLTTAFEPKRGNLTNRTNNLFNWNENFTYDELDRLLTYNNAQGQQETQTYDAKGKITQNNLGTYNYTVTGKTYQNNSITLSTQALDYYKNRGTGANSAPKLDLDIAYNTFKSPATIKERGRDGNYIEYLSFTYNDGNDRSTMFYGGGQEDKLLRPLRKHYSGDGTMEIKENRTAGVLEFVTYIGGDGYSAPLVVKSDGTAQNYLYLHRDYQGTILAVTDNSGSIVEKRLFDAWGAVLKVQNGAGTDLGLLTVLDRGYTGHEHLQSIGIINMNGRLYDPKLHRFLQPDNFIQDPANTQNYNRYGYVLNNPLKYTDPSGEYAEIGFLAAVGIGAAIAAVTYTLTALLADVPFSVGGLVKSTFIGAASAAVTFGIGSAAGTIGNFYVKAAVSAVAHGTFQGSMTAISGGKFWSGFAAGALSSIASSLYQGGTNTTTVGGKTVGIAGTGFNSIGDNLGDLGTVAFGTVAGGTGAALTGGNFWQGAVTGLVVSGLNHFAHMIKERNMIRSKLSDPDGRPEINKSSVASIKKEVHSLFTKDMIDNESRPQVIVGGTNGSKNGDFEYEMSENGNGGSKTMIKFYNSAFKSNYILARTILHEYYHAGDFYSGNAGMAMYNLRYVSGLKGDRLQNAYTDYFEKGAFNFVRGLGASNDSNYFYDPKLYHR
ncbi:hypothetical protein B0A80_00380 [Flavobacterium tructae]|uniref:RHS repeat-associated core domain-containing protein n=1 Tax=Flavobacterium tructae TaxID=1114873 RepID=UPI000B5BDA22|nr:RHS repeat-associated core domain-containing protein [Flavobacterium tructae]OXB25366.1 hypothetical protein B0A80_00380 [Flavobacterium tructae]